MAGTLTDTYLAAIQHDLVDLPEDVHRIGVIRRPMGWVHGAVDENRPALGPPDDLLDDFRECEDDFTRQGICESEAHNAAWDTVDYPARYREHLETDPDAQAAIDDVLDHLDSGTDVALVCFENTDTKRCHRTILCDRIDAERA